MALESLVLGGIELNDDTLILESFEAPPPAKRAVWLEGPDVDGATLARPPRHEMREITIRVRVAQQASMDDALERIRDLVSVIEDAPHQRDGVPLVWTPADATVSATAIVRMGQIEGVPVSWQGDDVGWFIRSPVLTMRLTCDPYLLGDEETVTLTQSMTTPIAVATLSGVKGDVPAEARLEVTDTSSQSRRWLMWGAQWRHTADTTAAHLYIRGQDMTPLGNGSHQPGAGLSAVNSQVLDSGTLPRGPYGVSLFGRFDAAVVGTFRVIGRLYSTNVCRHRVQLAWTDGDGEQHLNDPVFVGPDSQNGWEEVDLGVVRASEPAIGTGRLRLEIGASLDEFDPAAVQMRVDYLVLVPIDAGHGVARMAPFSSIDTSSTVAADTFNSIGGGVALTGRVAEIGGTWTGIGGAVDFLGTAAALGGMHVARQTGPGGGDASPVIRWPGSATSVGNVLVGLNVYIDTANFPDDVVRRQVYARINATGTQYVVFEWIPSSPTTAYSQFVLQVAGAPLTIRRQVMPWAALQTGWYRMRMWVFGSGYVYADVSFLGAGGAEMMGLARGDVMRMAAFHSSLATGGANETGRVGFGDMHAGALTKTITRYYDDFRADTVVAEPVVMHAGKRWAVCSDGQALREAASGTTWGATMYRGTGFTLHPAGEQNRQTRIVVIARRLDPALGKHIFAINDMGVSDTVTLRVVYRPRFLAVPGS